MAVNSGNAGLHDLEVKDLSLREKVGQVLMLGFGGKEPEGAAEAVCDLKAGGIIYFARNTGSVEETAALSRNLQEMAASSGNLPLLISADQEGGPVARLDRGLPLMPGPMSLGAAGDPDLAFQVARATGTQLRAAGINVNLAPVLDVNDNPANPVIGVRSFGSDPALVETLGTAAVRGFLSAGIAPVGKHFPGHGNTSMDSHFGLPVLPHPLDRLAEVELRPFKSAVRAGLPAIMTAHILFSAIDPERPATLSEPVLKGLLRRDLGFQGVIMTDCMEMRAIADHPGTARGAVLALKAGADMVLISHTPALQREAYEMICEAVKQGEIPLSRLDDAVRRVLALKKALRVPNPLPPDAADTEELRLLSEAAHLRSMTVLRSEGVPLRVGPDSRFVILSPYPATSLGEALGESGARVVYRTYGEPAKDVTAGPAGPAAQAGHTTGGSLTAQTGPSTQEGLTAKASPTAQPGLEGTVIALTENAWKNPKHAECIKRVLREKPETIVVATRDPYDYRLLPEARSFICTYSRRAEALRALAQILTGTAQATGRLPVTLQ